MPNFIIKMMLMVNGTQKTIEKQMERFEDALNHGFSNVCDFFKITNKDGIVLHDSRNEENNDSVY